MSIETSAEVVTWDERWPDLLLHWSFPCYRSRPLWLKNKPQSFADVLGKLAPLGYRLKVVLQHRHGFLWLKTAQEYIFEREFTWNRQAHGAGWTGSRITKALDEQLAGDLSPGLDPEDF